MNILVAEPMAAAGIELLKAQPGWNVIISNPKEYANHLIDAEALLVRSAVKVTADVLAKAPKLRVIGRAGVGVDNVDLAAATEAGVLVMNTPGGNAVSVAEHTLALMLAMARSIPEASLSTKSGKWEKKRFLGNELRGKTLGVVGLGSIGREVVRRARPFEMRIMAADPYVSSRTAADLGIELVDLPTLYANSDYVTLHVALTHETQGMLNERTFGQMKRGVRIVNCARGELVDGEALCHALESGQVAAAALDVFQTEPPVVGDPLMKFPQLIATPHIGGSTEEAQEIVGVRIAQQLAEYLLHGVALNAVNMPAISPDQYRVIAPFIQLAERLGNFAAYIAKGQPCAIRLVYSGKIADENTHLIRNAAIAGVLARSLATRANVINAMQIAADRGLSIGESREAAPASMDSVRVELQTDDGVNSAEGAVVLGCPRLMRVDGIACEARLDGHLTLTKNEDVPGVIGYIGTVLGKHGVNIANFSLGRRDEPQRPGEPLEAVALIETDSTIPDAVLQELLKNPSMKLARSVEFGAQAGAAAR